MMTFLGLDFAPLASAFLALVTAIIASAAVTVGRRTKDPQAAPPAPKTPPVTSVSMAGAAIISQEAVNALSHAIEINSKHQMSLLAFQKEVIAKQQDELIELEKDRVSLIRDLCQEIMRAVYDLTKELQELRNEIARKR